MDTHTPLPDVTAMTSSGDALTSAANTSSWNETRWDELPLPMYYSLPYIIVGFLTTSVIFLVGVTGNVMVVLVVWRTAAMHSPTNCYLVSLAMADILLLVSAPLPTIIEYFLVIDQSVFGSVGCSMMVFFQYLGLNVSSLSITAFTIERYIAICHPMKAQAMCTLQRAKRIILALWIFGIVYCAPWLILTTTRRRSFADGSSIQSCTYRLGRQHYVAFYMADLVIFYALPLLLTLVLYGLIGRILFRGSQLTYSRGSSGGGSGGKSVTNGKAGGKPSQANSRVQVVKMLAVVVMMFAMLWLPYRLYVVYNSFAETPYHDLWFRMFCRIMVYINSAINPILYNAMSVKFRRAFRKLLCLRMRDRPPQCHTYVNYQQVTAKSVVQRNASSEAKSSV